MRTVTMPKNWDNSKGWEHFYSSIYPQRDYQDHDPGLGSIGNHLEHFTAELTTKNWRSIWVPGCGLSPFPRVLCGLGFDVHATDISPTAIAFQQSEANDITDYLSSNKNTEPPGTMVCEVQDFKQPYLIEQFHVILNVKAFQGFSPKSMRRIAQVHHAALKPSGHAYFDTRNVQGERRDVLEQSLVDAGFHIPFFELTIWYRRALRETHIPHLFILGRPFIQKIGEYASDETKWEQDLSTLRNITDEYQTKCMAEQERELAKQKEEVRIAIVIYSTG